MRLVASTLALAALAVAAVGQKPLHSWTFGKAGIKKLRGSIRGGGQTLKPPLPEALIFRSRDDRVVIARSIRNARLPQQKITVEAWVMLDAPRPWGGFFSALQDNGSFEKGVLLGYRGSQFCFAIAGKGSDDGDGKLTYLTGSQSFRPGQFQHVVGVYDGAEMTLYVDGKRQASSKTQRGAILYPRRAVVEIGAYHDDDEDFPLDGLIGSVRVWGVALSAASVQREFAAGAQRFAMPKPKDDKSFRFTATKNGLESGKKRATAAGPIEFDASSGPPSLQLSDKTSFAVAKLDLPRTSCSIEATFRLGGNRRRQTIAQAKDLSLSILDGKLRFGVGKSSVVIPSGMPPHRWHHVVATWDGSLVRLYLDGKSRSFARTEQNSVDTGTTLHIAKNMQGRLHELMLTNRVLSDEEVGIAFANKRVMFPKGLHVELGPYAQFTSPRRAQVRWKTGGKARSTWLEVVDTSGNLQRVAVRTENGMSVADVTRMRPGLSYDYRILMEDQKGKQRATATHLLDTDFAYATQHVLPPIAETAAFAKLLSKLPTKKGYAVVLGSDTLVVTLIAAQTELQIVVVEPDRKAARVLRQDFAQQGIYGRQVSVLSCPFAKMSIGSEIANVVIVATKSSVRRSELDRICRPLGGVVLDLSGKTLLTKGAKKASGDWTHQYGSAANTAASDDELVKGDLELQWFGRPGPRPMMDRGCRPPAPLSTNGRLFIHGDRRLIALDSYNGTILWALEIPALRRTNVPRDCSNITARDDDLFAAVVDRLWRLDAQTGRLKQTYDIPDECWPGGRPEIDPAWGFVHTTDDAVLGTSTKVSATFRGAEGEWYDKAGAEAEDVLGTGLFSLDKKTGATRWSYRGGMIVHPTISLDKDVIYFVEDRKPSKASRAKYRLVTQTGTDQYLVAIEVSTGHKIWERKYDFRKFQQVFYLSVSKGVLVSVGVSGGAYHTHTFDASTGTPLWQQSHKWKRDHHGGGLQHPVIIDGVIYLEFKGIDLRKGNIVRDDLPDRRGCGTMSGAGKSLFFRHYDHTMWDLETNKRTTLPGLRSGCWLSLIPAGGLLLAPESSSGCSCANPIQTSVAYRPAAHKAGSK